MAEFCPSSSLSWQIHFDRDRGMRRFADCHVRCYDLDGNHATIARIVVEYYALVIYLLLSISKGEWLLPRTLLTYTEKSLNWIAFGKLTSENKMRLP